MGMNETDYRMKRRTKERQEKKKRAIRKRMFIFRLCVIILCLYIGYAALFLLFPQAGIRISSFADGILGIDNVSSKYDEISLSGLYSKKAVLMELESGEIIADRNGNKKMYPASLTKIMTALVAIENIEDLQSKTTFSGEIYDEVYENNGSMSDFLLGETVKYEDVLYGVILQSGGDCCMILARDISGSEEDFVKLMNQKAKELGMENTNFVNCTGLHDSQHYSTAEDMAKLLKEALENQEFRKIFTSWSYTVDSTNMRSEGFGITTTMYNGAENFSINNGEISGGKTGYTSKAGLCLASLAEVNGREYILITGSAEGDHYTVQYNIKDAVQVYNQVAKSNIE